MKIVLIILTLAVLIFLFNKYRNTKAGFFIRFAWFAVYMVIFFFFFSQNFTLTQNLAMAVVAVPGLIYFGYNLKKILEN
jgi:hypothetical protein